MLRLFGITGLPILVSMGLAMATGSRSLYWATVVMSVAVLALFAWLHRSLPPRSGTLRLTGLAEAVEVYRDNRGIPHIYAQNPHDLYMAQGYLTARDRLWAMDFYRRMASGRLAEVLGAQALHLDMHFRTLGLHRAAQSSWQLCSSELREHLTAYAEGVNAAMAETLPFEFSLLRYRPTSWTGVDSLLMGKYLAYNVSETWSDELFRMQLIQAVGAEKAAELFGHPPVQSDLTWLERVLLPNIDHLMRIAVTAMQQHIDSAAYAVAGVRTQTGLPLLGCDIQLPLQCPSLFYQSHLVVPDVLDVIGTSLIGTPGITVGQNREISWGITHLGADVQDIYIERVHPTEGDQIEYKGVWEKAIRIQEEIQVRSTPHPVQCEVLLTRHGPVIAKSGQTALTLRWAALEPTTELPAILEMNRARSWPEFKEALRSYSGAALGFLYAGRDGTIAWRAAGNLPIRSKGDGQAPVEGWSGEYDWVQYVSFEELPEVINPSQGFIARYSSVYRLAGMEESLRSALDLNTEKMCQLQTDYTNLQARSLLQVLLHGVQEGPRQGIHLDSLNETEKAALLILSEWDGDESASKPAPALWHQWYLFLLEEILRPQMGLPLFDQFMMCKNCSPVVDRLILHVAEGHESMWLSREGEMGLNRVALRSFRRAVALLAAKQGRVPARWRWGREHEVRFIHPLAATVRSVKLLLNLGPYPVGGSANTAFSHAYSPLKPFTVATAPAWRQVVDVAAPSRSLDILAPGQSGHLLNPHFADQVSVWLKGELQPRLYRPDVIQRLPHLLLTPAPHTARG